MVHKYQNAVQVYLWAPLLSSATSAVLETGKGALLGSDFPLVGKITKYDTDGVTVLKREIVNITNRSGDVATIARAYETCPLGTASSALQQVAQDFDTNDILEIVVSKKCLDDFNTDIENLQTFQNTTVPATYATKTELANSQLVYGASSAGSDAYAITVANVSAYANGQKFTFLADVGNTWAATFKVNSLSALPIKKNNDQDLATWDIEAGQLVEVIINNTDGVAEMVSQVATIVDLSGYTSRTQQYTAGQDISATESVYPSAASTVKAVYPSAIGSATAVTTSPTTTSSTKSQPLSTNTRYLHITGGNPWASAVLRAQVRSINDAETDMTNSGAEVNVYTTWNGTRWYDVCPLWSDKFLIIFQADTAGSGAGIKAVVISVSGLVVTVWSVQGIESTGNFNWVPWCAKVDTDKACIFYQKDSDGDLYVQVLTVSTTTITTNTPVLIDATSANMTCDACELTTNKCVVAYWNGSSGNTTWVVITVSGTTPTVNTGYSLWQSGWSSTPKISVCPVSDTKFLFFHNDNASSSGFSLDYMWNISVSGTVLSSSTGLNLVPSTQWRITDYYWCAVIGTKYAIVGYLYTTTEMRYLFVDISWTNPTAVWTHTPVTISDVSWQEALSVVKVSPWTYHIQAGSASNSDYILKLTPSSWRIGLAESAISNAALGAITLRFQLAVLSWLTAWSTYYVDDNAKPTPNSSLTAPVLGTAISSTSLLMQ